MCYEQLSKKIAESILPYMETRVAQTNIDPLDMTRRVKARVKIVVPEGKPGVDYGIKVL